MKPLGLAIVARQVDGVGGRRVECVNHRQRVHLPKRQKVLSSTSPEEKGCGHGHPVPSSLLKLEEHPLPLMVIPSCFPVEVGVRGGDNDHTLLAEQHIAPFSMRPSGSVRG